MMRLSFIRSKMRKFLMKIMSNYLNNIIKDKELGNWIRLLQNIYKNVVEYNVNIYKSYFSYS